MTTRPTRTQYLDINSTGRNRQNSPNPCDFSIPLQQNNKGTGLLTAIDPVSFSIPTSGATSPPGQNVTGTSPSTTQIVLDAATETTISNFYAGDYLDIDGEIRQIVSYNSTTFTVTLATPLSAIPAPGTVYYTRKALPVLQAQVAAGNNTASAFHITGTGLSSQPNAYSNCFVRFLPDGLSTVGSNPSAVPLRVLSYDPATGLLTVQGVFPVVPQPGDQFEFNNFDEDTCTPLLTIRGVKTDALSTGKIEVELLWLAVPNVILSSGYNGQFQDYPFIYISLYNEGQSNAHQVMFSNNPFTEQVIFKVPITELCGTKTFIVLKDCKQKQTIPLRLDQDLHFTMTDPDGNIISFKQSDSSSPAAPNPLLQISAMFGVKMV